jgi:hypothetical protein
MQRVCYYVNERPKCIWHTDPILKNVEFLRSIDTEYFEYHAKTHEQKLNGNDRMLAALSLRSAYSHGLEAFFAFLCSAIQAPHCVFGWLSNYQITDDLRALVEKISTGQLIKTVMPEKTITWKSLSERIHAGVISDNDAKQTQLIDGYEHLWKQFASDFLNKTFQKEYNCIKHGFRAKSCGFNMTFGDSFFSGSDYGSRFYTMEKFSKDNNYFMHEHGLNWHPKQLVERLHLISASISNIVNRILLWFEQPITPDVFKYPSDFSSFHTPWDENGIEAFSIDFKHGFKESSIHLLTREEIHQEYNKWSLHDTPNVDADSNN